MPAGVGEHAGAITEIEQYAPAADIYTHTYVYEQPVKFVRRGHIYALIFPISDNKWPIPFLAWAGADGAGASLPNLHYCTACQEVAACAVCHASRDPDRYH